MHSWNQVFDAVYCLNLASRPDRYELMEKRFSYFGLNVERFNAIPGDLTKHFWASTFPQNPFFKNPNYIACAMSHMNIFTTALARGQKKILIIEDDIRIHRDSDEITREFMREIPEWDLIHLSYIPLTDDLSKWNYNILDDRAVGDRVVKSKNLWSLMGYAVNEKMMRHLLDVYASCYPMELDRYLVGHVQNNPEFKCFACRPQPIAGEDGYSDNAVRYENGLYLKTFDSRFSQFHDYI